MESCPDTALLYAMSTSKYTVPASPLPTPSPQALHLCAKIPPIVTSGSWRQRHHWHPQFRAGSGFWLDLTHLFFDLIKLNFGLDMIIFNWFFFPIQFDSRLTYLFLIWVTQFESHSSQALGSPTLARVSPKYPNTEIVEYSTILIIQIGFGENTLTKIV